MSKKIEDIIMKNIFDLFKGDSLQFFGIEDEEITAPAKTELNYIQTQENITDYNFYTNKDWIRHFEFQTTDKQEDLARFMVSDAVMFYKQGKPIKTIVIYSADIERVNTVLEAGSIRYEIDAFYMVNIDGDKKYNDLKGKIERQEPLTKQDLISITLLPIMKSEIDKITRIEQSIELSKKLTEADEQLQIQAMLNLLAEKFIKDKVQLSKVKEMLNMTAIGEMIQNDKAIEIAKNLLNLKTPIDTIATATGLSADTIKRLKEELNRE